MSQTPQSFDVYCSKLKSRAAHLAHQAQIDSDAAHLHAYQFGRTVQRCQDRTRKWLTIGFSVFVGFLLGVVTAGLLTFVWR